MGVLLAGATGPALGADSRAPARIVALGASNTEGYGVTSDARTVGKFGTWIGVAGVALAGAGAYLWFFAPRASTERELAVVPTLTPDSAGLSALGRF